MATHQFKHTYRLDKNRSSETFGKRVYAGSECRNAGCQARATFPAVAQVIG